MGKTCLAILVMSATLPLTLLAEERLGLVPLSESSAASTAADRDNPYSPEPIDCDEDTGDVVLPDDLGALISPEETELAKAVVAYVLQDMCETFVPDVNAIIVTEVDKAIAATQNAERQHYEPELAGKDAQISLLESAVRDANRRIADLQRRSLIEDLGKFALGSATTILGQHLLSIGGE